jgi:hypothetical protein
MEFSSLKSLSKVYPLLVKKYETFIPDMTEQDIVTKINSLIVYLNNIGKLSNDTATQWNNVMKWILSDGLTESVDKKIVELVSTGQFAELLELALDALNIKTNERLNGFETALNGKVTKGEIVVNVKDYGAKGDGTTDDTTSIQNAIESIKNVGGVIYFPAGSYKVTSTLMLYVGVSIKGVNLKRSIILYRGLGACITFPDEINWTWGYIEDIHLSGTSSSTVGIYLKSTNEGHINRVNFDGFSQGGIEFFDSYSTKITDCRFAGMTYGIKANVHANALYFKGCQFNGQSEACAIIGSGLSVSFDACNMENATAGIKLLDGAIMDSLTIRDSYCEYLTNGLLYVPSLTSGRLYGFLVESCMYMGNVLSPYAINIDSGISGGAVRGTIFKLDVFDCNDSALNIVGNDSRVHTSQVCHWNYTTWAEKKIYSDATSLDVTGFNRSWKTLNVRGDLSVPSLIIQQGTLPVSDESYRGKILMIAGGSGTEDKIYICLKNSLGGYGWFPFTIATN